MKKEKLIIEYIKNYLKYYEKNTDNGCSIIFFIIRTRIIGIEELDEEKLEILNETMKKQLEE